MRPYFVRIIFFSFDNLQFSLENCHIAVIAGFVTCWYENETTDNERTVMNSIWPLHGIMCYVFRQYLRAVDILLELVKCSLLLPVTLLIILLLLVHQ
uniref:Uncharacterized protein n=1 Tax=Rhipicephalus microplus TaxID=6941 RepID=A0A6G5AH44_RHIMP